ncbi:MAG: hypothetical protein K8I30_19080, partial [Anaerolineae bacterium]|nr:hypothetical protein [Anaerolineae bacterium]
MRILQGTRVEPFFFETIARSLRGFSLAQKPALGRTSHALSAPALNPLALLFGDAAVVPCILAVKSGTVANVASGSILAHSRRTTA